VSFPEVVVFGSDDAGGRGGRVLVAKGKRLAQVIAPDGEVGGIDRPAIVIIAN
jgi:hypothetical protein